MKEMIRKRLEMQREEAEKQLHNNAEMITSFRLKCSELENPVTDLQVNYMETIGIVAQAPALLQKLCPELSIDKDGLYDLNQLRTLFKSAPFPGPGLLVADSFMIMAHPFFRRGMHRGANWESRFIEQYWRTDIPAAKIFLALDPDRVRLDLKGYGYIELDTWHGAKFNHDIPTIKDGIGQWRPPGDIASLVELVFGSAYSLNTKWSTKDNLKTFQAEAYLQDDILFEWEGDIWHPVRYIHTQYDLDKNQFIHLDGAIHFYQPADYKIMREKDLDYNFKHAEQIKAPAVKIFKIDDYIPLESWMELISQFFPHNPLIFEYFEGKYPEHIQDMIDAVRKSQQAT